MNGRRTLPQQTLDRLATLYEYADGDPVAGDEEKAIDMTPHPAAAVDNRQRTAESERLLQGLLRAHEGDPDGGD